MRFLVPLAAWILLAPFARAQMLEDPADHTILSRDSSAENARDDLSLSNRAASIQVEPAAPGGAPKNSDPLAPWNNPLHKNDPLAPHNDPARKDDPLAPWNSPAGSEKDLSPADRKAYGLDVAAEAPAGAAETIQASAGEKVSPDKIEVSPSVETIGEK